MDGCLASSGYLELGMFDVAAQVLEEIEPEEKTRNDRVQPCLLRERYGPHGRGENSRSGYMCAAFTSRRWTLGPRAVRDALRHLGPGFLERPMRARRETAAST
jgi:hypothetical protein